jgi:hypothetical protein
MSRKHPYPMTLPKYDVMSTYETTQRGGRAVIDPEIEFPMITSEEHRYRRPPDMQNNPRKRRARKSEHGDLLLILIVAAFTVPIFRSGLKSQLSFFSFVKNHTIFGAPGPEYIPANLYIPKEDYGTIFSSQK